MSPKLSSEEIHKHYAQLLRDEEEARKKYQDLCPTVEGLKNVQEPPSWVITTEKMKDIQKAMDEHEEAKRKVREFLEQLGADGPD